MNIHFVYIVSTVLFISMVLSACDLAPKSEPPAKRSQHQPEPIDRKPPAEPNSKSNEKTRQAKKSIKGNEKTRQAKKSISTCIAEARAAGWSNAAIAIAFRRGTLCRLATCAEDARRAGFADELIGRVCL